MKKNTCSNNKKSHENRNKRMAELAGGVISKATGGFVAVKVVTGVVGAFGTAGTGTAISSLSGAAATKATLAWLGGGTLAAGGFGITGGAVVLTVVGVAGAYGAKKVYKHALKHVETLKE